MKCWFLPISGDLRVGGSFQLEGNAGGEILVREPPRLLVESSDAATAEETAAATEVSLAQFAPDLITPQNGDESHQSP